MSLYTTEVRYICETAAGRDISVGYNDLDDILTPEVMSQVMPNYPIFDESYRNVLNKKILMHYYTREISEETVGLWKLRMRAKMNEIMPYYNKLYESELLSFNPLYDYDLTKTGQRNGADNEHGTSNTSKTGTDNYEKKSDGSESNLYYKDTAQADSASERMSGEQNANSVGSSKGTNETNADRLKKYSDTPQGAVQNLLDGTYLTNAEQVGDNTKENTTAQSQNTVQTDTSSSTSKSGSTTVNEKSGQNKANSDSEQFSRTLGDTENAQHSKIFNSTEDYLEHVQGKISGTSYSKLLKEYRETFLNIDMMIIDELKLLFFGLWG